MKQPNKTGIFLNLKGKNSLIVLKSSLGIEKSPQNGGFRLKIVSYYFR